MMRLLLTTCALLTTLAMPAWAQDAAPAPVSVAPPVEISADNGLVWDRAAYTYTAKGSAEVKQGDMKVTSDVLIARYSPQGGSSDIIEITADGNVVLSSSAYTAHGDKAVYDLTTGVAVLTGKNLRVLTATETLTARDRLTYAANDGRMMAQGGAVLKRATDSLMAETLTAQFGEVDGKRMLDTVTASGGVTITTPRETVTGNSGVYRASSQQAELTGDVVITQGKNKLEGARAVVDMKSGVSKLFGGAAQGGRVKGVFYPGAKTAQLVQPAPPAVPARAAVMNDGAPVAPVFEAKTAPPLSGPATAPARRPQPAQDAVTDSIKGTIKESAKDQMPAGESVSAGQKNAIEKEAEEAVWAPLENAPAAPKSVPELTPEPFAVPPATAVSPTAPRTPAAADKPDMNR